MKVQVDASIFSKAEGSIGMVSGRLELASVPPIGSKICFTRPVNTAIPPNIEGFTGHLIVEDVIFMPSDADIAATAMLADIVVATLADARKLMEYMETGFGLCYDEFGDPLI